MDLLPPAQLSSASFSFYTAPQARKLSVKEIKSAIAYDSLNCPVKGGLYDPAMGVSPYDKFSTCTTCGQEGSICPGHPAHLELAGTIFNPFLLDEVLKLLKAKCYQCHKLRINQNQLTYLTIKAKLIAQGALMHAQQLTELLSYKTLDVLLADEAFVHLKTAIVSEKLGNLQYLSEQKIRQLADPNQTAIIRAKRDLNKEVFKSLESNVCPHCRAKQYSIKKENNNKITRVPLSDKVAKSMSAKGVETLKKVQVLHPEHVRDEIRELWVSNPELLTLLYGESESIIQRFFLESLIVPSNRFRPESHGPGDQTYLHMQTIALTKIIGINQQMKELVQNKAPESAVVAKVIELQSAVNLYMDSSLSSRYADKDATGLRQLLEKKEGLFRLKMMGKRVNYAARSVISPDPYLDTNEIGIPVVFAKKLSMPEVVTERNANFLKQLIRNGPNVYPGANMVEDLEGNKIVLDNLPKHALHSIANKLVTRGFGKIVYRHVMNGDWFLVNRQPTLHKPSIMAHRARVLPRQNTIRMHYSNCNTYNADFDGDEINLHLPQTYLGQTEAKYIVSTDNQYCAPTSGKPLRGLIQDHIVSGVLLTCRDSFFTREEYQQLIYSTGITRTIPPCILKPKELWSGKQIISTMLQALATIDHPLNLEKKCKVPGYVWAKDEEMFILKDSYLCTGVLDKSQIGSEACGMVHAFHELYGERSCANLLTALGKLLTMHLQINGFTCGMEDLILTNQIDDHRRNFIEGLYAKGILKAAETAGADEPDELHKIESRALYTPKTQINPKDLYSKSGTESVASSIQEYILSDPNGAKELDIQMISVLNKNSSALINDCLPGGLVKKFPDNYFSLMVLSGGKGSIVNHKHISCMLGQQELEGRRVPMTLLGKTAPCFIPFDPHPRAGGFVADRFLSGLRPQEYFFHCMAGREGLVDTAVKTSKSGYMQRCLVKGMEGLMVSYDNSVRDSDGSIVQFAYGEDCVDPLKTKYLKNFEFIAQNTEALLAKYNYKSVKQTLDFSRFKQRVQEKEVRVDGKIVDYFKVSKIPGKMSESAKKAMNSFIQNYKKSNHTLPKRLRRLVALKYLRSLMSPGEAVGVIAAQSIGEPSTQLTLNTFHLAGHGGANVTLGIPRLREILMTTAVNMKTPSMTLPFLGTKAQAYNFANQIKRLKLKELVQRIKVREKVNPQTKTRQYTVELKFERLADIENSLNLTWSDLLRIVKNLFIPTLISTLGRNVRIGAEFKVEVHDQKEEEANHEDILQSKPSKNEDDVEEDEELDKEVRAYEDDDLESIEIQSQDNETIEQKDNPKIPLTSNHKKRTVQAVLELPISDKNVLMLGLVEQVLEKVNARSIEGIDKCHIIEKKIDGVQRVAIQTEGVNFQAMWQYPQFVELNKMQANDLVAVLKTYGIEACNRTIIQEIANMFDHYGIEVDKRHLTLIADHMTFNGTYRPFNRISMSDNPSPLLRMSFETTMTFMTESALLKEKDPGLTPAARIVLGVAPKVGTGSFKLFNKLG
jgi:DNA-directed RNA polymerase I subunit RPA1